MNAANAFTVLRLFAVIPFALFLGRKSYTIALIFFTVAAVSDLIDGYIARKFDQKTRLGAFLDPLADKLLVFAGNLYFVMQAVIPAWFFVLVILKDLSIFIALVILRTKKIDLEPNPNIFGKIGTFLLVMIIFLGIIQKGFYDLGNIIEITVYICSFFTVVSWYLYWRYFFKLIGNNKVNRER